jgi:hypothetical protein
MNLLVHRAITFSLIGLLATFVLVRGVLPAFQVIDTDFPNYYTAGKLVLEGGQLSRLYDDRWFQERIRTAGIDAVGKFSPFPPITALFCAPLALVPPQAALQILTVLSLGAVALSMVLLARILQWPARETALLVLFSGSALVNSLRFGQIYCLLSFLIILGFSLSQRGKPVLAGMALGLMLPVKYFPAVFIPYFLLKNDRRLLLSMIATAAVVFMSGIPVMGWEVHREYLFTVLPSHLGSHYTMQDPYSTAFQSWDSLLLRLFVQDPRSNPSPFWDARALYIGGKVVIIGGIVALLIVALYQLRRNSSAHRDRYSVALLGIVALLIAPGTATYHFVLLWLPVALLIDSLMQNGMTKLAAAAAGAYALIGFLPYSFFRQWEGYGPLSILAYPRLLLLTALFTLTLVGALSASGSLRWPWGTIPGRHGSGEAEESGRASR